MVWFWDVEKYEAFFHIVSKMSAPATTTNKAKSMILLLKFLKTKKHYQKYLSRMNESDVYVINNLFC